MAQKTGIGCLVGLAFAAADRAFTGALADTPQRRGAPGRAMGSGELGAATSGAAVIVAVAEPTVFLRIMPGVDSNAHDDACEKSSVGSLDTIASSSSSSSYSPSRPHQRRSTAVATTNNVIL